MRIQFWHKTAKLFGIAGHGGGCHGEPQDGDGNQRGKIISLGGPNVGKSVIFNNLTGARVTVSN
jgi:ribosome-interacting GTPase 1